MANCEKCGAELQEGVEHVCATPATEAPAEEAVAPEVTPEEPAA